jgi:hypothetical protein
MGFMDKSIRNGLGVFHDFRSPRDLAQADVEFGRDLALRHALVEHLHQLPAERKGLAFGFGENLPEEFFHDLGIFYPAENLNEFGTFRHLTTQIVTTSSNNIGQKNRLRKSFFPGEKAGKQKSFNPLPRP